MGRHMESGTFYVTLLIATLVTANQGFHPLTQSLLLCLAPRRLSVNIDE